MNSRCLTGESSPRAVRARLTTAKRRCSRLIRGVSAMKILKSVVVAFIFVAAACSPYFISYKHVCLAEENGVEILERSTVSNDSQGNPLLFARAQMPLRAVLKRPAYVVEIDTPQNAMPVAFLNARSPEGAVLEIVGAHVRRVHPDAVGYTHTFYVREADGKRLEFLIRDGSGRLLGEESLPYEVRSRGIVYGIEAI